MKHKKTQLFELDNEKQSFVNCDEYDVQSFKVQQDYKHELFIHHHAIEMFTP